MYICAFVRIHGTDYQGFVHSGHYIRNKYMLKICNVEIGMYGKHVYISMEEYNIYPRK